MEIEPLMAKKIGQLAIPSEEELNVIRADIDPGGFSTSRGRWMTVDRTTGKLAGTAGESEG